MVSPRGAVPLILTGTSGLALLAFGVGGLSSTAPQIEQAARTVQLEKTVPAGVRQFADCPPGHDRSRRAPEV